MGSTLQYSAAALCSTVLQYSVALRSTLQWSYLVPGVGGYWLAAGEAGQVHGAALLDAEHAADSVRLGEAGARTLRHDHAARLAEGHPAAVGVPVLAAEAGLLITLAHVSDVELACNVGFLPSSVSTAAHH